MRGDTILFVKAMRRWEHKTWHRLCAELPAIVMMDDEVEATGSHIATWDFSCIVGSYVRRFVDCSVYLIKFIVTEGTHCCLETHKRIDTDRWSTWKVR